jgi:hypothetical protein
VSVEKHDKTHKIIIYVHTFVGLAYKGKDIVFRFNIECSSLRDFYRPLGNNNNNNNRSISIWGFLKDNILACIETLSYYRVII